MPKLNPEWSRFAMEEFNRDCDYYRLLALRITALNYGEAKAEVELGAGHMQSFGVVHGGVAASLLDSTGFWALYTMTPPEASLTTVEMKLNYLAPATDGVLKAVASSVQMGKRLGLAQAEARDADGRLVAAGTVTCMALPGGPPPWRGKVPAKFL